MSNKLQKEQVIKLHKELANLRKIKPTLQYFDNCSEDERYLSGLETSVTVRSILINSRLEMKELSAKNVLDYRWFAIDDFERFSKRAEAEAVSLEKLLIDKDVQGALQATRRCIKFTDKLMHVLTVYLRTAVNKNDTTMTSHDNIALYINYLMDEVPVMSLIPMYKELTLNGLYRNTDMVDMGLMVSPTMLIGGVDVNIRWYRGEMRTDQKSLCIELRYTTRDTSFVYTMRDESVTKPIITSRTELIELITTHVERVLSKQYV